MIAMKYRRPNKLIHTFLHEGQLTSGFGKEFTLVRRFLNLVVCLLHTLETTLCHHLLQNLR